VSLTLNHPVSFNYIDIALQSTNGSSTIWYDQTALFSLGGVAVPEPSSNWYHFVGTTGGLDFATGFETGTGTFTFDKVIVNTVITALTDPLGGNVSSIVLTRSKYPVYAGFYGANVATTPLPGALLLMMTALGGLGIFAGRRRAAAAVA
jgi:hypothetical protein